MNMTLDDFLTSQLLGFLGCTLQLHPKIIKSKPHEKQITTSEYIDHYFKLLTKRSMTFVLTSFMLKPYVWLNLMTMMFKASANALKYIDTVTIFQNF